MRVLCIGAYGNGNLGDMYQADAMASLLLEQAPDAEIHSLSQSDRELPYPFSHHRPLPYALLDDTGFINGFDLLVVGGGGLLAVMHAPLDQPEWLARIEVPIVAFGLGCGAEATGGSTAFIEKCALFSARDEASLEVVLPFRPDAEIIMDPIYLSAICEDQPKRERQGICLIPSKLTGPTSPFYERYLAEIHDEATDAIVSLNEGSDRNSGFEQVFGPSVRYVHSHMALREVLRTRALVVSERYHGCIFGAKFSLPTVALVLREGPAGLKVAELYRRTGVEGAILGLDLDRDRNGLFEMAARAQDVMSIREPARTAARAFLRKSLALVGDKAPA